MDWNDLTPLEQTRALYSDLYKDVYGSRPRGFSHLTLEELDAKIARLDAEIADRILDDAEDAWKRHV